MVPRCERVPGGVKPSEMVRSMLSVRGMVKRSLTVPGDSVMLFPCNFQTGVSSVVVVGSILPDTRTH